MRFKPLTDPLDQVNGHAPKDIRKHFYRKSLSKNFHQFPDNHAGNNERRISNKPHRVELVNIH